MNVETGKLKLLILQKFCDCLVNNKYKILVKPSNFSKIRMPLTKENFKKDRTIWRKSFNKNAVNCIKK